MSGVPAVQTLHTERLELRPVLANASPEALAALAARVEPGGSAPEHLAHARLTVRRSARAFSALGYGLWWIVPAGESEPVGWCGLKDADDPARPELMFGLTREARGRGLATEAVRAVVAHAFGCAGVVAVWGAARPENEASARVMLRAGLAAEGVRVLDGRDYATFGTGDRPAGA